MRDAQSLRSNLLGNASYDLDFEIEPGELVYPMAVQFG